MSKNEFCIMDDNYPRWRNFRDKGLVRHEIFFGRKNRQKSIDDGLVVFLTRANHNMSDYGVHFNKSFDLELKQLAQTKFCEYYNKTDDDFIKIFRRNYK